MTKVTDNDYLRNMGHLTEILGSNSAKDVWKLMTDGQKIKLEKLINHGVTDSEASTDSKRKGHMNNAAKSSFDDTQDAEYQTVENSVCREHYWADTHNPACIPQDYKQCMTCGAIDCSEALKVAIEGSSMDSNTNDRSVPKTSPTPVEVGGNTVDLQPPKVNETTKTLDIGDNLDTLLYEILRYNKFNLSDSEAVKDIKAIINQTVSKELEDLLPDGNMDTFRYGIATQRTLLDRIEFYRGKE